MKRHLTGFGISALLHAGLVLAALPVVLLQSAEPPAKEPPLTLDLAQFQPPPPVVPQPVAPAPEPKPVPKPIPKPKPVPKPEPKPVPKPIPKPKPVPKPEPKPVPNPIPKPKPEPKPVPKPIPKPIARPEPIVKAVTEKPQPETVSRAESIPHPAPPQPVRPIAAPKPVPAAPAAPKPAPATNNPAAEAAYRAKLQSLIAARKQYPSMAEKMEAEGTVSIAFTVLANGAITGAHVANSSGNQWLDQAAVQAVNAVSGALPFPADIHKTQWAFTIGVNFRLE
jgi:protein TonB